MANLASLTCDIPNSNNNWKWVLMTEDEYLLAQCCQHYGYDPNAKAEVKLGKETGNIFDCSEVQTAGLYKPPETNNVAQIHSTETKHNKPSTNYTHYAHTNLACVLDIIEAVLGVIISHLFPDDEHTNQASALEALEKRFATLHATDVVKITAVFYAPYDTAGTIDEYLRRQINCIKKLRNAKFSFNMHKAILTCVHHMELLPQLTL